MMPIRAKLKPQRKAGLEMVASHAVEGQARKNTKFPSRLRESFFHSFCVKNDRVTFPYLLNSDQYPAFPTKFEDSQAQNLIFKSFVKFLELLKSFCSSHKK
jgi:hypothetical protein